jgi:hypothetical protein
MAGGVRMVSLGLLDLLDVKVILERLAILEHQVKHLFFSFFF